MSAQLAHCYTQTHMPIWVDMIIMGSFAMLSYFATAPDRVDVCGMQPVFTTGIVTILIFIYTLSEPCITRLCSTPLPPVYDHNVVDEQVFEIGGDDLDGVPLAPDIKSNIRIDTMTSSTIWTDVYGLGFSSFCLLYSLQSHNELGNAVLCTSFLTMSCIDFFSQYIRKEWNDNPLTSRLTLVRKCVESNTSIFVLIPSLLLVYLVCNCVLFGNALGGVLYDGWYILLNVALAAVPSVVITGRQYPRGIKQALKLSMPVSVMVSVCFVSVAQSMTHDDINCSWGVFFSHSGHMLWDRVVTTCILPIPAMFTLWTVLTSCNAGRTLDVATIILAIASLRVLPRMAAPTALSATIMAVLISIRLYHCIYPRKPATAV
jgi:hypothetical protein